MFQFINDYITNWPKLHQLFSDIAESHIQEAQLVEAQNARAEEQARKMFNKESYDSQTMHDLSMQQGGARTSREIGAGSIFVVLNTMLDELKKDLQISEDKFCKSGPLFASQSFGAVVRAASNNFRHMEEWRAQLAAKKPYTKQQLNSIEVLAPVLGFEQKDYGLLADNVCPQVLDVLGGNDFEELERHLFTFANKLAVGVENNKNGVALTPAATV